jgi:hypothetical protein
MEIYQMTDITKCPGRGENGEECPLRDKCWRYLAPADPYAQSWTAPSRVGDDCDIYFPIKD